MAKDIFSDDYFSRHRDNSSWDSLKGKSISKVLNLKNKPKVKLDDVLPLTQTKDKPIPEEIIDSDFKDHIKVTAKWKKEYLRAIITGVCGGLIFYLATFITATTEFFSKNFWVDTATIVLVALVIVISLGVIYKLTDNRL